MVDFAKLATQLRNKIYKVRYTYRCQKCGKEDVYVIALSGTLREHYPTLGRCKGKLVETKRFVCLKVLCEKDIPQ